MENQRDRLNRLRERLKDLEQKMAISENRYLVAETVLQQAEKWMTTAFPSSELQINLLVIQGLDTAEHLIESVEKKNS